MCPHAHAHTNMELNEFMSRLPKETRERLLKAADIQKEFLITPSPRLDRALQGGLQYGRQILIWGHKAAGKSTFCLQTIANAQKKGDACVYIDAERTFDKDWAKKLGVDTDALHVTQNVKRISDMSNTVCDLMEAGARVIVVDSINGLIPDTQFKDGELVPIGAKGYNGSQGQFARGMADAVGRMNNANHDTVLILISQARSATAGMFWIQAPTGGNAVMFNSSTVIQLKSTRSDVIEDDYSRGNMVLKEAVGRKVSWLVEHHKTSKPGAKGDYVLNFAAEPYGIDRVGDLIEMCIEEGLVRKSGSWLYYAGSDQMYLDSETKWQGAAQAVKALHEDEKLQNVITEELYAKLG